MSETALRWAWAGASLLAWLALCAGIGWRERARRRAESEAERALGGDAEGPLHIVAHGTQTGSAEALAWDTARALHALGPAARVMALNRVDAATLARTHRLVVVTSTYGEGDPPDGASVFAERVMGSDLDLSHLRFALLSLGDRQYTNFCGFGRQLDAWLRERGAHAEHAPIEVDNGDPASLERWFAQWGADFSAQPEKPRFEPWTLRSREHLNPGSVGAPIQRLVLTPPAHIDARWASGDLLEVRVPADPERPREYSIASVDSNGALELVVREERRADGSLGLASGLLTRGLDLDAVIDARLKPHHGFRLEDNAGRPLLLVGNGTGIAGLRAHLQACAQAGHRGHWLVFGERHRAHDRLFAAELDAWLRDGTLARVDLAFSRDEGQARYVQHLLDHHAEDVRAFVAGGAAVYVCGSLAGMAPAVDASLREALGAEPLLDLTASGRYRRDVY